MLKLNPVNIKIDVDLKNMNSLFQNEESIDSSLENLFSFLTFTNNVEVEDKSAENINLIKTPEDFLKEKNKIKNQIKNNYIPELTVVLYSKKAPIENSLTIALDKAKKIIDSIDKPYKSFDDLPEEIKKEADISKLEEFLDNLGIDENSTPEEIKDKVEDSAQELINSLNGVETDDPIANAIMEQVNDDKKNRNGLWKDIFEVLEHSGDGGEDIQCIKYSTGLATVVGSYFTTGTMHIAVHLGGNCITGVGTSVANISLQNLPNGFKLIQDGTKSTDLVSQCNAMADGFSEMIAKGIITSIVIGMMNAAPSPIPFVGAGQANSNQHTSVKILIFVAALAAAMLINSAALAAMLIGSTISAVSAAAFGKLISELEKELKEKINIAKNKFEEYTINDFDEILNDTSITLKEKAEKIIDTTSKKVEPKIEGLKDWSKEEFSKLSESFSKKLSSVKQDSLLSRFGKGSEEKINDIEKKVKNEIPKEVNKNIDEQLDEAKKIANQKGKELTEEEINKIIEEAKNINSKSKELEDLVINKMFSKIKLLIGMLKTISILVSTVIGLSAENVYKKYIGIGTTFENANDFTAMLLSAAVKASIALTMVQTQETTAGSTGTGLLLPVGP